MANKYSVVFTEPAEEDLDGIYGYISQHLHNTDAARTLMESFQQKILRLEDFPLSCPVITILLPQKEYRRLNVGNYLVFYRVDEAERCVYVVRILYASRNYLALLDE